MSASPRLEALEGLLARVRRNLARPRAAVAAPPAVVAALAPLEASPTGAPGSGVGVETSGLRAELASSPHPTHEPEAASAPSGVVPLQDELDTEGDLELDEGELIDVTDLAPDEVAALASEVADQSAEVDEVVPSSARREKGAPTSMDEALASVAAEAEDELERSIPLQTPPPESGRQRAPIHVPTLSEPPEDLLDVGGELTDRELRVGPTPEQLGQTIELDEPLGGDLELDQAGDAPTPPPPPRDELEHELPGGARGAYDESLELPPEARDELARHRAREVDAAVGEVTADLAAGKPVVVERPALHARPAEWIGERPRPEPRTFLELLDGSLAL